MGSHCAIQHGSRAVVVAARYVAKLARERIGCVWRNVHIVGNRGQMFATSCGRCISRGALRVGKLKYHEEEFANTGIAHKTLSDESVTLNPSDYVQDITPMNTSRLVGSHLVNW